METQGWAIAGTSGLYTGWWQTRRGAIVAHTDALYETGAYAFGGLSDKQKEAWRKCQAEGDRAVKVEIREI